MTNTDSWYKDSYPLWVKHWKGLETVLRAQEAGRGESEGAGERVTMCAWDTERWERCVNYGLHLLF